MLSVFEQASEILASRNWRIAFAESATAGLLCSAFSQVSQSGKVLIGGINCYDASICKEGLLHVRHELIEKFTPESAEVTRAIAEAAVPFFNADVAFAVTGLLTPGGSETAEKPVGTMFFHLVTPEKSVAFREEFDGGPNEILAKTLETAASILVRNLAN